MENYTAAGTKLREEAKTLVYEFMKSSELCQPGGDGMRLAEIFRACGLDWGTYENSTSSNQQYWVVALIRELEAENKVERAYKSGPWRLRNHKGA